MKRTLKICLGIILIIAIILVIIVIMKKQKDKEILEQYEPEEEISLEQERETMVSLYFKNKTTSAIEPEVRLVDVKELVDNPYITILNLLIEGPKNDNLESTLPEGTLVNSAKLDGDILMIDFSNEFVNNHIDGKDSEMQTIESIVNTMTELSEVNAIKITINGEENKGFKDNEIMFSEKFTRSE